MYTEIEKKNLNDIKYWSEELNFQYNIEGETCYVSSSDYINHWKFNITNDKNIILFHRDRAGTKVHYHKQKKCNDIKHIFLYIKQHDQKYIKFNKHRRESWQNLFSKLHN